MAQYEAHVARLLATLDRAWQALNESWSGLTEEERQTPGVIGDWSIKDIMAHITTWDEEALTHLPLIAAGGRPPRYSVTYGGIDAFNAGRSAAHKSRSLSEVELLLAETHQRLISLIESTPPEMLTSDSRYRRRLRLDTYGHYPIHTDQIRVWRSTLQRPE